MLCALPAVRAKCPRACGLCGGTKGAHQGANAATCKASCIGVSADKIFAADQVNVSVAATLCNYAFSGSNTGFNGVSSQVVTKQQKGKYVTYYNEPGCIWPLGITDQEECALAVTDMWDERPKSGLKSKLPTHSRGCYVQDTSVTEESAIQGFKFAINQGIDSSDPERWSDSTSKRIATGCDLSKRNCQCPMGFNLADPGICIRNDVTKGGDAQVGQWCKLKSDVKPGTRFKTSLTQGKCSAIASKAECSAFAISIGKTVLDATSSLKTNPKGCFQNMTDQQVWYSPDTDGECALTHRCTCSQLCTHGQFGNLKGVARRRRTSFTLNSICRKPGLSCHTQCCSSCLNPGASCRCAIQI